MADTPESHLAPAAPTPAGEKVATVNVAEEIKNCFLDYSMSVIISRALPDVRDGLKPSQRRILYAMHELGVLPNRKHVKCAKIVGETMGNYHPHGDQAIYPTLVHMAQPWSMREPLVDGQGNFGSIEGDPPASMRYTEARLAPLGALLMEDMDKDTVDFVPNYDDTRTEPSVFPAAFPNLLVNGGTGIAVGMATNIPPHNLGEVIDAVCAQIDNPAITVDQLMRIMPGPDFPTGCMVCGRDGIRQYYETGRGTLKVRGRVHVEETRGGREQIVITEIPFGVNRAALVERIAELVNQKTPGLTDITGIRDESDENTRVVLEIKRDAVPKVIINNLYRLTQLESTFAVNMLAIDRGRPRTLTLKDALACYIEHRREVVLRRTRFELRRAEERAEILEGYLIALANLDEFIRIIRQSRTREEARVKLLAFEWTRAQIEAWHIHLRHEDRLVNGRYGLSEAQVDAILDLRLYQLTGLEVDKVRAEYRSLLDRIRDLQDILAREERVLGIIKTELQEVKKKYASPRRTEILDEEGEMAIEDLVANEPVIITLTHAGLIKRTHLSAYRTQHRGGKGVIGMTTRESPTGGEEPADFIEHLFAASTHDYLMFFTNTGRVYVERVLEIPDMGRTARGRSIANLLELKPEERIAALIRIPSRTDAARRDVTWAQPGYLFFATRRGTVKKTALEEFANVRKGGIIAMGIEEGDSVIDVKWTSGNDEVVLITRQGMSIRFSEEEVRPMGRPAFGVRGIELEPDDEVVAMAVVQPDATLLVVGENGLGKRTSFEEYRTQGRGGKGIITMKTTDRTGPVVGALTVRDHDQIVGITIRGQTIRTYVRGIPVIGRNTQGVKIINLEEGDRVQAIAPVIAESDEEEAVDRALPAGGPGPGRGS
ncbi:DNA gyrase subunit A [Limisphaera ngatamarikiensis]|uniref:DNA gyrase subunit A n=1 Tax=Limisphaera ngatamarikiensis TaxID=1324935 RepID=A0A6M1RRL5_9BACT|nr:DNA gyrase subunit A [Limisphaera ngatamarikiensis]NGO37951.1 DNA gyrase subunit A [Limisphaera ngatamarikiensis]